MLQKPKQRQKTTSKWTFSFIPSEGLTQGPIDGFQFCFHKSVDVKMTVYLGRGFTAFIGFSKDSAHTQNMFRTTALGRLSANI